MGDVGVWSRSDVPQDAPNWARYFTSVGREMAERPNQGVGEVSPVVFLSVPTGQYAAWFLAAGALGAPPKTPMLDQPGDYRGTTWVAAEDQVADANVLVCQSSAGSSGLFTVQVLPDEIPRRGRQKTNYRPAVARYQADRMAVVLHPQGTPEERRGQLNLTADERSSIREAIAPLLPRGTNWYYWWTQQCLSPVVLVGTGSEFLMRQRAEILKESPSWVWPTSRTTLALDMKRLCDPLRLLLFPFSVISPTVGGRVPWLRSLRPRLVIYTSWTAFSSRHPATFAGVPAVVLVNRRVESSLKCADAIDQICNNDLSSVRSRDMSVRGIDLRLVEYPVVEDDGLVVDVDDDEEQPDEF